MTLMLLALPAAAMADVYRSVDAQGHVQYSDTPTPGATLIHVKNPQDNPSSNASNERPAAATHAAAEPALSEGDRISQQLAHEDATREVQRDRAAAQAEECKKAKDSYQQMIQARRILVKGADGQTDFVPDDQAEQMRVKARENMQKACNL